MSRAQAEGDEKVFVCPDCHDAFKLKNPQLCKFSLANHMWIGRWDPLFRHANIAHHMLLALARTVTTKVKLIAWADHSDAPRITTRDRIRSAYKAFMSYYANVDMNPDWKNIFTGSGGEDPRMVASG